MKTRGELLADLAGHVNELCDPRLHTEILESSVTVTAVNTGRGTKSKRTRQRRQHIVTLPSLIDCLTVAMSPSSTGDAASSGGFESRPSAELEPINVMRLIREQATRHANDLGVRRDGLKAILHGLVGAAHTDTQLRKLAQDAAYWARRARIATGFDPAPFTIDQPCPYCWTRHAITVTGDLLNGRCNRCGAMWDELTIGLLGQMMTANQTQTTMTLERCGWDSCHKKGPHVDHSDGTGRTWRDTCELDTA